MAVYALGDLHGRLDMYTEIKAFLKPDDIVYFLGDAVDRGPDSWKTFKAIINDDQFIYVKGNHEDMLYKAYKEAKIYEDTALQFNNTAFIDCAENGGEATVYEAWCDPEVDKYMKQLNDLPTQAIYKNKNGIIIAMSHAGYTPNDYSQPSSFDLLWDREHFYDPWDENNYKNTIIIHGHTPINFMWEFLDVKPRNRHFAETFWYCNNHKICIDMGSYASNIAILLNLDTFDEEIFCPMIDDDF